MPSTKLAWLADTTPEQRRKLVKVLNPDELGEFLTHWGQWARKEQLPPEGDWRTWLMLAGRGYGKTRAGAEWTRMIAESNPDARIALVSSSIGEARSVMVEGESGILACSPLNRLPRFEPSRRRLIFANGAQAQLFSAAEPESLRGPQHSHAWCDEIGKWPLAHERATRCWDNLVLGLRLGEEQRVLVTTTPRSVPLVRRLVEAAKTDRTVMTGGKTQDNCANLPAAFIDEIEKEFGKTQLARQEIGGELIDDVEGALWNRALLERARDQSEFRSLVRVVVGVDPPASARGDACGIIIAGYDCEGIGHVLADCSVESPSPEQWAQAVALSAREWKADRIVAEANQGGAMVESVLRAADCNMPVKLVHASRGKSARAEPVAALYETGRVRHHGFFPEMEDQLCGLMTGGEYLGPGRSPDRADALVWAMTELMLRPHAAPNIRTL
ncbi:DNA-packaging protein [Erythrobacter sp. HA6-11]